MELLTVKDKVVNRLLLNSTTLFSWIFQQIISIIHVLCENIHTLFLDSGENVPEYNR